MITHKARFINLQRHVWLGDGGLQKLHPCAALTLEELQEEGGGFSKGDLSFTPHDCYSLWAALQKHFTTPDAAAAIADLAPRAFFLERLERSRTREQIAEGWAHPPIHLSCRLSLRHVKEYEETLKGRLEEDLARDFPAETGAVLQMFLSAVETMPEECDLESLKKTTFTAYVEKSTL